MDRWAGRLRLRRWAGLTGLMGGAIALSSCLVSLEAMAQVLVPMEGASVTLSEQGVRFKGETGGDYGLMRLAARDRRRRLCLGYGSEEPDHVLILAEDVARLNMSVMSDGDTTLLIEGPRGVDCNDNYRRNSRDAAVQDGDWPAGTYRIWVGSFERGDRIDYELLVSEDGRDR